MHVSKDELSPMLIGEYQGRQIDAGGKGHFVQTLEPVELLELSPVEEHDGTMATVAENMGLAVS
jgi:hypothetical protein